jgi:hypothetical protein
MPLVRLKGNVPLKGKPVPVKVNAVLVNEKVVNWRVVPVVFVLPKPALIAGSLYAMRSSPPSTIAVLTINSLRFNVTLAY